MYKRPLSLCLNAIIILASAMALLSCEKERPENMTLEMWQEDFRFAKEKMEEYCPTLYEYNSREELNQLYDSLYIEIKDTTDLAFYPILTALVAGANEAHFGVGSNEDVFLKGFYDNTFKYSPVELVFLGDKAFIDLNLGADSSLKRGDQVLAINGYSIPDIKARIMPHLFSDGEIESYKINRLNTIFPALYFWYVERPDSFMVLFRSRENGDTSVVSLAAMTLGDKRAVAEERHNKKDGADIEEESDGDAFHDFDIDGNTAKLKLKTFYWKIIDSLEIDAHEFYHDIFRQLRENDVNNLIVDLRDNYGGRQEFFHEILPFIMKEKRQGVFQESVSWKGKVTQYELPEPDELVFGGDIYVITNDKTFSNGSNLAKALREFGDAVIIGKETASRYEGFAAGSEEVVYLPNSRIKLSIPRYWIKLPISEKQNTNNRGILPDYEIEYSIDEYLDGVDKEMILAKRLISEKAAD